MHHVTNYFPLIALVAPAMSLPPRRRGPSAELLVFVGHAHVTPAKAGVQYNDFRPWIPAAAGMTNFRMWMALGSSPEAESSMFPGFLAAVKAFEISLY